MKYLSLFVLIATQFCFTYSSLGQVKPSFFPEEIERIVPNALRYSKPGVRDKSRSKGLEIIYGNRSDGRYDQSDTELQDIPSKYDLWEDLEFKLKVPIIWRGRTTVLIGYKYYREILRFSRISNDFSKVFQSIDNDLLKSNNASIIVSHGFNKKNYLAVRFRYSSNGNYNGFFNLDQRYGIYKFLAVYGIKPNEDKEWGIGFNVSKSFRRVTFLPFLVFNKNFNKKWGIETVLPGYAYMRRNLSDNDILLGGLEYGSQSFRLNIEGSINVEDMEDYAYNQSHVISSLQYQRKIVPWIWANLQVGYQWNFATEYKAKNEWSTTFDVEPSNGGFFRIGIFLSPRNKDKNK